MNGTSEAATIVAKQQTHPRHALILQQATLLPETMLEKSLAACFEEQAANHPQHIAVTAEEGSLTYQELNQSANQLAHHLLAIGATTTTPITIILDRSLHSIISILAILKIGGHYLYIEPTLPPQRAQDLLALSATQTIITITAHAPYVKEVSPAGNNHIILDQISLDNISTGNLNIPISPLQPSRLGFTSGSTGKPKPTLKLQTNYLYGAWQGSNAYLITPADRHAFVYQFSAGPSMRALFSALLTGGSVHLHPLTNYDMSNWATWIEDQSITQLYMPTVAFREFLHTRPDAANFPTVRMVYVGGQTIYRQDAEMFQRRFSQGTILVSRYAMSETSGLAHYLVDHQTTFEGETLPIGYPLPGRELLIVDEEGREVGFNQPGEIIVKSNAEDTDTLSKTANSQIANGTYFHTSDMGLMRPDGCLIHLGRKDGMIKVRGNRIALAEAENLLMKVNGVAQAAIKPYPTPSGDNRLIGYVTPVLDAKITMASVREEMSQLAPTFMVPARIVILPTMPLTTTGKIDRQALPLPASTRPKLNTPFVAPGNEHEQQIADIWADLLGLDEIGINDNFFDLGGDSITAMRMILKVETLTATTIPQDYFRAPTIAAFAPLSTTTDSDIASKIAAETDKEIILITPVSQLNTPRRLITRYITRQLTTNHALRGIIRKSILRLPYRQGVQWLAWLNHPTIAPRTYSYEYQLFHTLTQELNIPAHSINKTFRLSVIGNMIRYNFHRSWRDNRPANDNLLQRMQASPDRFWRTWAQQLEQSPQAKQQPLYHISGLEHLIHSQERNQGTILLTYHSTASLLANLILEHQIHLGHIPIISINRADQMAKQEWAAQDWGQEDDDYGDKNQEGEERNNKDRLKKESVGWAATYALQAQRILQKGGIVRIVNDVNFNAPNTLPKIIGQRHFNLKPGFAELALTTNATILPIYSAFDINGTVYITILPPLISQAKASAPTEFIQDLIDQYVTFLQTSWHQSPQSIASGTLLHYASRPQVVTSST